MTWTRTPTAEGIAVKLGRAKIHRDTFVRDARELELFGPYRFAGEVYDNGARHVYRAIDPPPLAPNFSAILGDCLHNIRSAIDHLACQLVIASGGIPTAQTQFPLANSPTFWNRITNAREPVRIDIQPGIRPDIIKVVESVQPYHRTLEGQLLGWLRELDNTDKHRQLVVTAHAVRGYGTNAFGWDGAINQVPVVSLQHRPLRHKQMVLALSYDPPRKELDPNLHPTVAIEFGDGLVKGYEVQFVLDNLLDFVSTGLVPRFMPFFF